MTALRDFLGEQLTDVLSLVFIVAADLILLSVGVVIGRWSGRRRSDAVWEAYLRRAACGYPEPFPVPPQRGASK